MNPSIETQTRVEDWEPLLGAALLEQDYDKLAQRIADAENAIINRAESLNPSCDGSETEVLIDALITLHDLRTVRHR